MILVLPRQFDLPNVQSTDKPVPVYPLPVFEFAEIRKRLYGPDRLIGIVWRQKDTCLICGLLKENFERQPTCCW